MATRASNSMASGSCRSTPSATNRKSYFDLAEAAEAVRALCRGRGALRPLPRHRPQRFRRRLQPRQLPQAHRTISPRPPPPTSSPSSATPNSSKPGSTMPASCANEGKIAAARKHLETALRIDPDYADAVYNLASLEYEPARPRRRPPLVAALSRARPDLRMGQDRDARHRLRRSRTQEISRVGRYGRLSLRWPRDRAGHPAARARRRRADGLGTDERRHGQGARRRRHPRRPLRVRLHGEPPHRRRAEAAAQGRKSDAGVPRRRRRPRPGCRAAPHRRQVDGRARRQHGRRRVFTPRAKSPASSASAIPSIRPASPSSCAPRTSSA